MVKEETLTKLTMIEVLIELALDGTIQNAPALCYNILSLVKSIQKDLGEGPTYANT